MSATDRDGNALSGLYGFVIDEGTAAEEFVVGTVSGTTVTITKRGLDAESPDTEVTVNKKAHRRGASVKITDYPLLGYLRNMLAAVSGYEIPAFLKYASDVGSPTDDKHLATKEYVDDAASAGTGIPSKIVAAGTAGETVAAGQLVYFDDTDDEWKLCDADTAASVENSLLGIAQGAGTNGNPISNGVLLFGVDTNQTGLTPGAPYYASNTAGAISSSAGTKEVTLGFAKSATELYFCPRFNQQLTEDQQDALAGGGTFGTPSGSNKFITQDYNASATGLPVVRVYTANTRIGSSSTQFDITNPSGTTFRYTFDGTGTDPSISAVTFPIGTVVDIQAQNFSAGNKGLFVVTGSGSNYFEVTNASGVAETNKTIGTGYIVKGAQWTKPAGLKYATVEMVGAGAGASGTTSNDGESAGAGAGGYLRKLIAAGSLGSTENFVVGDKGLGSSSSSGGTNGARTVFGSSLVCNGGVASNGATPGTGGTASGGDINIDGQPGSYTYLDTNQVSVPENGGTGGSTPLGMGGPSAHGTSTHGNDATGYGAGGGGVGQSSGTSIGGDGSPGVIILTEYFS